jgi:hypothetical protein
MIQTEGELFAAQASHLAQSLRLKRIGELLRQPRGKPARMLLLAPT